jgi:hypothetical protein
MGWFAAATEGPEWVAFGLGGPDTEVHVPLIRGEGDPRVRVAAYVGDDVRTLAALDLSPGAPIRIGVLLRIRSGLPEPRRGRVRLETLRVGDVLLRGVWAEEVDGEELVLGLGGLPGVGVHVRPDDGDVVWMPAVDARSRLAEVGPPEPWSLPPGPAVLAWVELVVDPSAGLQAWRFARHPTWTDADGWLATHLLDDARFGGEVTGPDFLDALRWGRVAPHAAVTGDLEVLREADGNLLLAAGDDCAALLPAAERAVRSGDPALRPAVARAAEVWAAWRALGPAERERRRERGEGVDDACASIGRFAGGEAWDPLDPWPTARFAWTTGSAVAARWARNHGADAIALRALALDDARGAGAEAEAAAARGVLDPALPHPLTRALLVADRAPVPGGDAAARVVRGERLPPEELESLLVLRPGDPAVSCLAAAAEPVRALPDLPEADCLAAAVVRARRVGDLAAEASARALLAERWPDVWVEPPARAGYHRAPGPP